MTVQKSSIVDLILQIHLKKRESQKAIEDSYKLEAELKIEIVKVLNLTVDPDYLILGSWDCENSPTGKCFYDSENDRCHDECLVCGEPSERK